MKRHLVMDLFHGNRKEVIGEWLPFPQNLPKGRSDKVWVKLRDDSELFCYYYEDHREGCYFWVCANKYMISDFDVKEWKYLKDEN